MSKKEKEKKRKKKKHYSIVSLLGRCESIACRGGGVEELTFGEWNGGGSAQQPNAECCSAFCCAGDDAEAPGPACRELEYEDGVVVASC